MTRAAFESIVRLADEASPTVDGAACAFARRSAPSAPGSRSTIGFRDVDASALIEVTPARYG
ncbi:hypothetical protein WL93_00230 [Burkholderia diffusa]|nr:hypothetical protein WJ62_15165 [Burkholderia diffusa]KWF93743.1 hypothetical protein WL93_00230 [Burkholderia diffusa]